MSRLEIIISMLMGPLKIGAMLFRSRDTNETGMDDIIAAQMETLATSLEKWMSAPKIEKL